MFATAVCDAPEIALADVASPLLAVVVAGFSALSADAACVVGPFAFFDGAGAAFTAPNGASASSAR